MGVLDDVKTLAGDKIEPNPIRKLSKKILVVEDEESLRNFYVNLLKSEGYEVASAENGEQGLNRAKSEKPDLILLDLMMPVLDGKIMLKRLREIPEFKTLPVIVLTNAGDIDSMTQTHFFDNASEFLIKSNVDPGEVIKKIKMYTGF
jgi:DNA-binding response OmpR family regulator